MPEQRIVVLVGVPGSGKSTWVARQGGVGISSDELRRWLKDDAADQSIHCLVFKLMRDLVRHRLALGVPVTVDRKDEVEPWMAGGDEGPWQEISRLAARSEGSQPAVTARRAKGDKRNADVRRRFKVLGVGDVSISRCRQAFPTAEVDDSIAASGHSHRIWKPN